MPFINGKFYANPAYGRGVEKARMDDLIGREGEGRDQGESGQIAARTSQTKPASKHESTSSHGHRGDNYNPATTPEGIGNQVYNETARLRPTSKTGIGPGTDWDMQQARKAIAHVIQNRAAVKMLGGLGSDNIAPQEAKATKSMGSAAYDAHGGSQAAAHDAGKNPDPTGGAKFFYLDHGQKEPPFAVGKKPVATFGPFSNSNDKGGIKKGAEIWIPVYR